MGVGAFSDEVLNAFVSTFNSLWRPEVVHFADLYPRPSHELQCALSRLVSVCLWHFWPLLLSILEKGLSDKMDSGYLLVALK